MTNVHIVNHTHWDREWYFTSMDSLVLSDQLFSDVIEELSANPTASFVLDGQLSILDDYLELYPEKLPKIKELVKNEQLYIGPWFTQTDAFFASGESILRNGMIGIFESKKYGNYMPIAYLPDTFGFNAQMPLILNEAGFESVIMWRGLHLGKHVKSPYFKWQSLNGETNLTALNFPQGYGTGMLLEPSAAYVEGRLDKAVDFLKQFTEGDVIIPSGNDQLGIIADFTQKIEQINELGKYTYKATNYLAFLDYIKEQELETYTGEFREPVLARVHKTIGSVRADLKQEIFKLEDKLTYRIEPMMVIGKKLGITLSNRLLLKAWKMLLESQAHDSLAGCVSDSVAVDIAHRLKEANEICDSIENIVMKRISEALDLNGQQVLVLNTSLSVFKGHKQIKVLSQKPGISVEGHNSLLLESEFVPSRENVLHETPSGNEYITEPGYYILTLAVECELAGLGYQVFNFTEEETMEQYQLNTKQTISAGNVSLSFETGDLVLTLGNKRVTNFISLEDEGNTGDTYDFSPLVESEAIRLEFTDCSTYTADQAERMIINGKMSLPYRLENRKNQVFNQVQTYQLSLELTHDGELKGTLQFTNKLLNHRLRLKITLDTAINSSLAALPYGFNRKVNQELSGWEGKFAEMPVNVEPFEKTVSVHGEKVAVSLFTQCSKEYEYVDNHLFVTVLATTDSLGKPDLLYRPGRASGDTTKKGHILMETPLAQMENSQVTFDFILKISEVELTEKEIASWRYGLLQPSVYYQRQEFNYFVYRIDNKIQKRIRPLILESTSFSVLTKQIDPALIVASIHNSYYTEDAFVVRFENPTSTSQALEVSIMFEGYETQEINALEEIKAPSKHIPPYGLKTLLVRKVL